ncbi:MAG: substrate-binding domain-containing protein [Leptothrix ochracea]|uniref:substrate-binding domain-containing protein n=1 Tax=Leptothrix ochracea TaxID=735331 RepID=UPI0034E2F6A2
MTHGICTNLPSACTHAEKRTQLPYDDSNSRCPKCGSPLLRVDESAGGGKGKMNVLAIAIPLALVALGGGWWAMSGSGGGGGKTSASSTANAENTVLRLHGSSTVSVSLAPTLLKAFLVQEGYTQIEQHPTKTVDEVLITARGTDGVPVRIEVFGHGSGTGFTDLSAGKADIAMSSRPIKKNELEQTKALGNLSADGAEYVVALEGMAIVTHSTNAITRLSLAQLRDIFGGKITDWSKVGGKPGPIKLISRDEKSGTYDAFKGLVMGGADVDKSAKIADDNGVLSDLVAKDPQAIGFAAMNDIHQTKVVAISDGTHEPMRPTKLTVSSEDYPLTRRLFLYVPPMTTNALAVRFAEFSVSPEAQKAVEKAGFIGQAAEAVDTKVSSNSPVYNQLVEGAQRLSINLRFQPGSMTLDNKAERDMGRIAQLISARGKKSEVMLLGFTDGTAAAPCKVSQERASAVSAELATYGVKAKVVYGFGAAVPMAADDTEAGRERNRRVEVWISDHPVQAPAAACKDGK